HYHTIQETDYLGKLSESYSALGIPIELDKPPKVYSTALKKEFKKSYFYRYGYFMENRKTKPKKDQYIDLKSYGFKNQPYKFRVTSGISESRVFGDNANVEVWDIIPKRIERKYINEAMSRIPYFRFNIMKKYMPCLKSKRDFVENDNWLGSWDHIIEFEIKENYELTKKDVLRGTIEFLNDLADKIRENYMKEIGTKQFIKVPVKDRLVNFYERSYKEDSQLVNDIRAMKAGKYKWSPYTRIISNNLERRMVKMLEKNVLPDLEEKYEKVYLIRNDEVYNRVRINEFNGTRRFLPDFILYLLQKDTSKVTQIYLEPKGRIYIDREKWKEDILKNLGRDAEISMEVSTDEFELLGVQFFTGKNYQDFEDELREKAGLNKYEFKLSEEN